MCKGFDQVTPEQWKRLIDHVRREFEDRCWYDDGLQEGGIDEFIILVVWTMRYPVNVTSSVQGVAVRLINTLHFRHNNN